MLFEKASKYFLPPELKNNPLHPEYEEKFSIINGTFWTAIFMTAITIALYLNGYHYPYYFYNALLNLAVLPLYKRHLQQQAYLLTNIISYPMYFYFCARTGGIYSANVCIMYAYLLGGLTGQPKLGPFYILFNFIFLYALYLYTPSNSAVLGGKGYALFSHCMITFMVAAIFIILVKQKDKLLIQNKSSQNNKIMVLNDEVSRRTKELNNMRKTLAADFHDETGNMLSAITRQASLLKLQPDINACTLCIVEHIIANSNQLYASSRHFIWNLNNDSDDPQVLFNYLISFGQLFYNQFDISFSAENNVEGAALRLEPFAAINLIFIFKEAMNNVVKHAEAKGVIIKMLYNDKHLQFSLTDDGTWKEPETKSSHHGLSNMEKRCLQNNFRFAVIHIDGVGTRVEIAAPVIMRQTVETAGV